MNNTASASVRDEIRELKKRLGDDVYVVGHHYQCDEVIEHCDARGDSLELARMVSSIRARHIVFCGVYFMGESAALLANLSQRVYLPEPDAECFMAKTASAATAAVMMEKFAASGKKVIPVAYVNSTLALKNVVGRFGGTVCTSANAEKMVRWALERGDSVFFLPDRNLGRNVGRALGIAPEDTLVLDIRQNGEAVDINAAARAKLLVWPGSCAIHARFWLKHVNEARKAAPGCQIVVHPECSPEVVLASDVSGSTTSIIRCVRNAAAGDIIYIGTEAHLVWRLAAEAAQRGVTVKPLRLSACSCMAQVTPEKLRDTLRDIVEGSASPVRVAEEEAGGARLALQRMLDVCR